MEPAVLAQRPGARALRDRVRFIGPGQVPADLVDELVVRLVAEDLFADDKVLGEIGVERRQVDAAPVPGISKSRVFTFVKVFEYSMPPIPRLISLRLMISTCSSRHTERVFQPPPNGWMGCPRGEWLRPRRRGTHTRRR